MTERSRERAMPVGKLDTAGRVTAEPCAAPLRAGTDGKGAFAGMHDAHKLRHRRHAATSDTSAKRRRYESCPSPVAASGLRRTRWEEVARRTWPGLDVVGLWRCPGRRARWQPRPRLVQPRRSPPQPPRSLPQPKPRPTASRRLRPASRPSRPTARPTRPRPTRPRRNGLPRPPPRIRS